MKKIPMHKKYRGFSLVETLVAMFVFVMVIGSVSQIFTQAFVGYREQKRLQTDLETAQFAVNTMAKELRTSSVHSAGTTSIKFFDYSQSICFLYRINGTNLQASSNPVVDSSACQGFFDPGAAYTTIASGISSGRFSITPSDLGSHTVGKVTVSLSVSSGALAPTNIQTTVSLRDYAVSGVL